MKIFLRVYRISKKIHGRQKIKTVHVTVVLMKEKKNELQRFITSDLY